MGSLNLSLYFARCLMLVAAFLSAHLPSVLSSHQVIKLDTGNQDRRYLDMQFTLAVPKLPSEEFLTIPTHRPVATPYQNDLVASASYELDPYTSHPHLSHHKPAEGSPLPSIALAESTEEETPDTGALLIMAYYPDWLGSTFPPARIDFGRFDWIDFAFAVPDAEFNLQWDDPGAPQMLKELVTAAHNMGAKVKLSVGGWTGSKHFSSAVASNTSRSTLVDNIVATYISYQLDGIDIDWEYPGKKGASGSHFHSTDSANFLSFLQLLRAKLPLTACISAAVETTTFAGNKGRPLVDLSEFAKVLDWVLIMNYDVWGSSRDPGPNAPLHDACNNSTQPDANAVSAYDAWTSANFPAHKLVLGLPSYGYISSSTVERLRTRSKSISESGFNFVTAVSEDGGSDSQIQFREMIDQGVLVRSMSTSDETNITTPMFIGGGGFERRWDSCSDTPYLRSTSSGQIIAYDDPESLGMKAAFAKGVGMRGVNLFDVHGDTDEWDLIDSVRRSTTGYHQAV